jgi:hypothetical protein
MKRDAEARLEAIANVFEGGCTFLMRSMAGPTLGAKGSARWSVLCLNVRGIGRWCMPLSRHIRQWLMVHAFSRRTGQLLRVRALSRRTRLWFMVYVVAIVHGPCRYRRSRQWSLVRIQAKWSMVRALSRRTALVDNACLV